ncbi:MAG: prephenate dehydrogenase [Clostridia bacterium]|nr:prephenate dehydrogenase [Clostridia bacterium]
MNLNNNDLLSLNKKVKSSQTNFKLKKAAIIGLGLIGGSIGLALLHGGLVQELVGYDKNRDAINTALDVGAINQKASDLKEAVEGAEFIILAVPVGALSTVAKKITPYLNSQTIVTDTGSVKGPIVKELEEIFKGRALFVGGHPMTGSEQAGIKAADLYLLENAVYVLTPTKSTDKKALNIAFDLFEALGSRVITLEPEEHDIIVAGVSHLPHFLAVSLMLNTGKLAKEYDRTLGLAAGGFRDTTRIAGGDPIMWRDIFLHNQKAILKMLKSWRYEIEKLEEMILKNDTRGMVEVLEQARNLRSKVPAKKKGLLPTLHELVVTVPDRPGVIGAIASSLGNEGINIIDIEILRVREGEGGSIRLGFTTASAANRAMEILIKSNIKVRKL